MGKLFSLLAGGALVAALAVPYRGLTLYQRVARRVSPPAPAARVHRPEAAPAPPVRRDRIVVERPKEKLSGDDRKALDRLVSDSNR
jgi:hypothetical protein